MRISPQGRHFCLVRNILLRESETSKQVETKTETETNSVIFLSLDLVS